MASPPKYREEFARQPRNVPQQSTADGDFGLFSGLLGGNERLDTVEVEDDIFDHDQSEFFPNPANGIEVEEDLFEEDENASIFPNLRNAIEVEEDLFDDTQPDPLDPSQFIEVEDDLFDDEQSFWFPSNFGQAPKAETKPKFQEAKPMRAPRMTNPAPPPDMGERALFGPEAGAYAILEMFTQVGGDQEAQERPAEEEGPAYYEAPTPQQNRRITQELTGMEEPGIEERSGIGIAICAHEQGAIVVDIEQDGAAGKSEKVAVGDLIVSVNGKDMSGKPVEEIVEELTGPENTFCVLLTKGGRPPFPTKTVVLARQKRDKNMSLPGTHAAVEKEGVRNADPSTPGYNALWAKDQISKSIQAPVEKDYNENDLRDWALPGVFNQHGQQHEQHEQHEQQQQ
eukprot:CAMPEP_0181289582 /NCGR_PEP_ID=MMETSP1101-20121128/956_1 /TAXON_ID=46948 /ORGANISM="Rhodomonas abbreviata, Strain Caron Lab Isolate" /LENGTH=397 /DNA_ID=CAMNT_0023393807 /DNA_START=96 /DNA_END=1286 /DNA_ORIENTATION=-